MLLFQLKNCFETALSTQKFLQSITVRNYHYSGPWSQFHANKLLDTLFLSKTNAVKSHRNLFQNNPLHSTHNGLAHFFATTRSVRLPEVVKMNGTTNMNSLIDNDQGLAIKLTHRALDRLKKINKTLRIQVESGGCSGFQYTFKIIDNKTINDDDKIALFRGQQIVIDNSSLEYLQDCIIDHVDELIRSSFIVQQNKLATSKCSCGHSFDIDISF